MRRRPMSQWSVISSQNEILRLLMGDDGLLRIVPVNPGDLLQGSLGAAPAPPGDAGVAFEAVPRRAQVIYAPALARAELDLAGARQPECLILFERRVGIIRRPRQYVCEHARILD